jgi:hypothetical protein
MRQRQPAAAVRLLVALSPLLILLLLPATGGAADSSSEEPQSNPDTSIESAARDLASALIGNSSLGLQPLTE